MPSSRTPASRENGCSSSRCRRPRVTNGRRASATSRHASSGRRGSTIRRPCRSAGPSPIRPRIGDEIWVKLWGNLSFNPISALTGATLDVICADNATRAVARAMMLEAQTIAEKLGVRFPISVDKRIDGAAAVGAHKTSMLQDLERSRPMEIDALVTSVQELGSKLGVPTPTIDVVLALVRQRGQIAGLYEAGPASAPAETKKPVPVPA